MNVVSNGQPYLSGPKDRLLRCYTSLGSSDATIFSMAVQIECGSAGYDSNQTCIHWTMRDRMSSNTSRSSLGITFRKGNTIYGMKLTSRKMGLQCPKADIIRTSLLYRR